MSFSSETCSSGLSATWENKGSVSCQCHVANEGFQLSLDRNWVTIGSVENVSCVRLPVYQNKH
jgi:hypothetical protein